MSETSSMSCGTGDDVSNRVLNFSRLTNSLGFLFFRLSKFLVRQKIPWYFESRRKTRSRKQQRKTSQFPCFSPLLVRSTMVFQQQLDRESVETMIFVALGPQVLWFVGSGRVPGLGNLTINQKTTKKVDHSTINQHSPDGETEAWV